MRAPPPFLLGRKVSYLRVYLQVSIAVETVMGRTQSDVCFWPLADVGYCAAHVRFWG